MHDQTEYSHKGGSSLFEVAAVLGSGGIFLGALPHLVAVPELVTLLSIAGTLLVVGGIIVALIAPRYQ